MLPPLSHTYIQPFLSPIPPTEKEGEWLTTKLLKELKNYPPQERIEAFSLLTTEGRNKALPLFQALNTLSPYNNWKMALLQLQDREIIRIHAPLIAYNNSHQEPIKANRFSIQKAAQAASLSGSTFFTNKQEYLNTEGHSLLDAAYAISCFSQQGGFQGFSLALGDGSGGHFGDPFQDKRIAAVTYTSSKWAARFLGAYTDPNQLKETLSTLLSPLKQKVAAKETSENSTLIACRLFPEKNGFRCIGFNIGDSLAFSWDPQTQTGDSLLPSKASEAGTALFPEPYRSFEITTIDTLLPAGSYIFLLSDGIHDFLPYEEEESCYPNGLSYRTRKLGVLSQSVLKEGGRNRIF